MAQQECPVAFGGCNANGCDRWRNLLCRSISDGTESASEGESGRRHVVVRAELWCAPCNLIRKPPAECDDGAPPECLRRVEVDDVHREAARLLREAGGYAAREPTGA